MNEQKLKLILKQLTTLANLQDKKNKIMEDKIQNLIGSMCYHRECFDKIEREIAELKDSDLTKSTRIT